MAKQYHIHLEEGDCAPYVLLPGDPGRVEKIAAVWDESRKVAQNREYVTYTGVYKGMPITCTSTGIGGASTAIALEELARVGAKVFLRIGTCGTFQDHVRNGDMIIFDSALRLDGVSRTYAPAAYPAVADYDVVAACVQAAKALKIPYHVGMAVSVMNVFDEAADEEYDPAADFDQSDRNVVNLARMGSEALYLLAQMDAKGEEE
jgi:uridine phosphorylase